MWCAVQQSYCKYTTGGMGAEITGSIQIASGSEKDLQTAVAYVGPIAVAVDASSSAFRVSNQAHLSLSPLTSNPVHLYLCGGFCAHIHSTILEECTAPSDVPGQD